VAGELRSTRGHDPVEVTGIPHLTVQAPQNVAEVQRLRAERLDAGEAEAIALALELHANDILIDERRGRLEARRQGLRVTGVLGVLLQAKRAGFVPAVKPLIDRLQNELRFFISVQLREQTILAAGESTSD
jgi:hypothetical protein